MASFQGTKARGFTLIEMSIVLIIIGLIIGGILKGQELIESSRQKNLQAQIDGIRSAFNTFQDRFKAIPGDYSQGTNISALAASGNGDGQINALQVGVAAMSGLTTIATAASENLIFFNQLAAANMIGGVSTIDAAANAATGFSTGGTTSPLPASSYPQTGLTVVYGRHIGLTTNGTLKTTNWLRLQQFSAGAVTNAHAALSPQRAFQFDTKFDETTPYHGRIRTDYSTATTAAACGTAAAATYAAANTVRGCILYIAID
jgi:prepilin-type N-terminal cleavage/methylation domain-containing protein